MVLAIRLAYVPMTMVNGAVLGNLREPFCSELCYRGRCVDKVHHALGGRDDRLSPPEFLCLRLWTASGCSLAQGTSLLEFIIPYLVVLAYIIIATSHISFYLSLLSDILSILQVMSPDLKLLQY